MRKAEASKVSSDTRCVCVCVCVRLRKGARNLSVSLGVYRLDWEKCRRKGFGRVPFHYYTHVQPV